MTAAIRNRIAAEGPLSFSAFQELALYGEGGYFSTSLRAGRRFDFLTSPTIGVVFGAVLSRAVDRWWQEIGCPDTFHFVEWGAGDGSLAKTVLTQPMSCAGALRYIAVERSDEARLRARTAVQDARFSVSDDGPLDSVTGVVFAHELLDNIPVDLFEFRAGVWSAVRVGLDRSGELVEVLTPAPKFDLDLLTTLELVPREGTRVPLQRQAMQWIAQAKETLSSGSVVCVDYTRSTTSMAEQSQEQWLRTYAGHSPGVSPLLRAGRQDITCEVAIDQLELEHPGAQVVKQASFLERYGIDEIVDRSQRAWQAGVQAGSFASLRALDLVREARALTDPNGLGAFDVIEWRVPDRKAV